MYNFHHKQPQFNNTYFLQQYQPEPWHRAPRDNIDHYEQNWRHHWYEYNPYPSPYRHRHVAPPVRQVGNGWRGRRLPYQQHNYQNSNQHEIYKQNSKRYYSGEKNSSVISRNSKPECVYPKRETLHEKRNGSIASQPNQYNKLLSTCTETANSTVNGLASSYAIITDSLHNVNTVGGRQTLKVAEKKCEEKTVATKATLSVESAAEGGCGLIENEVSVGKQLVSHSSLTSDDKNLPKSCVGLSEQKIMEVNKTDEVEVSNEIFKLNQSKVMQGDNMETGIMKQVNNMDIGIMKQEDSGMCLDVVGPSKHCTQFSLNQETKDIQIDKPETHQLTFLSRHDMAEGVDVHQLKPPAEISHLLKTDRGPHLTSTGNVCETENDDSPHLTDTVNNNQMGKNSSCLLTSTAKVSRKLEAGGHHIKSAKKTLSMKESKNLFKNEKQNSISKIINEMNMSNLESSRTSLQQMFPKWHDIFCREPMVILEQLQIVSDHKMCKKPKGRPRKRKRITAKSMMSSVETSEISSIQDTPNSLPQTDMEHVLPDSTTDLFYFNDADEQAVIPVGRPSDVKSKSVENILSMDPKATTLSKTLQAELANGESAAQKIFKVKHKPIVTRSTSSANVRTLNKKVPKLDISKLKLKLKDVRFSQKKKCKSLTVSPPKNLCLFVAETDSNLNVSQSEANNIANENKKVLSNPNILPVDSKISAANNVSEEKGIEHCLSNGLKRPCPSTANHAWTVFNSNNSSGICVTLKKSFCKNNNNNCFHKEPAMKLSQDLMERSAMFCDDCDASICFNSSCKSAIPALQTSFNGNLLNSREILENGHPLLNLKNDNFSGDNVYVETRPQPPNLVPEKLIHEASFSVFEDNLASRIEVVPKKITTEEETISDIKFLNKTRNKPEYPSANTFSKTKISTADSRSNQFQFREKISDETSVINSKINCEQYIPGHLAERESSSAISLHNHTHLTSVVCDFAASKQHISPVKSLDNAGWNAHRQKADIEHETIAIIKEDGSTDKSIVPSAQKHTFVSKRNQQPDLCEDFNAGGDSNKIFVAAEKALGCDKQQCSNTAIQEESVVNMQTFAQTHRHKKYINHGPTECSELTEYNEDVSCKTKDCRLVNNELIDYSHHVNLKPTYHSKYLHVDSDPMPCSKHITPDNQECIELVNQKLTEYSNHIPHSVYVDQVLEGCSKCLDHKPTKDTDCLKDKCLKYTEHADHVHEKVSEDLKHSGQCIVNECLGLKKKHSTLPVTISSDVSKSSISVKCDDFVKCRDDTFTLPCEMCEADIQDKTKTKDDDLMDKDRTLASTNLDESKKCTTVQSADNVVVAVEHVSAYVDDASQVDKSVACTMTDEIVDKLTEKISVASEQVDEHFKKAILTTEQVADHFKEDIQTTEQVDEHINKLNALAQIDNLEQMQTSSSQHGLTNQGTVLWDDIVDFSNQNEETSDSGELIHHIQLDPTNHDKNDSVNETNINNNYLVHEKASMEMSLESVHSMRPLNKLQTPDDVNCTNDEISTETDIPQSSQDCNNTAENVNLVDCENRHVEMLASSVNCIPIIQNCILGQPEDDSDTSCDTKASHQKFHNDYVTSLESSGPLALQGSPVVEIAIAEIVSIEGTNIIEVPFYSLNTPSSVDEVENWMSRLESKESIATECSSKFVFDFHAKDTNASNHSELNFDASSSKCPDNHQKENAEDNQQDDNTADSQNGSHYLDPEISCFIEEVSYVENMDTKSDVGVSGEEMVYLANEMMDLSTKPMSCIDSIPFSQTEIDGGISVNVVLHSSQQVSDDEQLSLCHHSVEDVFLPSPCSHIDNISHGILYNNEVNVITEPENAQCLAQTTYDSDETFIYSEGENTDSDRLLICKNTDKMTSKCTDIILPSNDERECHAIPKIAGKKHAGSKHGKSKQLKSKGSLKFIPGKECQKFVQTLQNKIQIKSGKLEFGECEIPIRRGKHRKIGKFNNAVNDEGNIITSKKKNNVKLSKKIKGRGTLKSSKKIKMKKRKSRTKKSKKKLESHVDLFVSGTITNVRDKKSNHEIRIHHSVDDDMFTEIEPEKKDVFIEAKTKKQFVVSRQKFRGRSRRRSGKKRKHSNRKSDQKTETDQLTDSDELPTIFPPKRRQVKTPRLAVHAMAAFAENTRIMQKFPQHNWTENKNKERSSPKDMDLGGNNPPFEIQCQDGDTVERAELDELTPPQNCGEKDEASLGDKIIPLKEKQNDEMLKEANLDAKVFHKSNKYKNGTVLPEEVDIEKTVPEAVKQNDNMPKGAEIDETVSQQESENKDGASSEKADLGETVPQLELVTTVDSIPATSLSKDSPQLEDPQGVHGEKLLLDQKMAAIDMTAALPGHPLQDTPTRNCHQHVQQTFGEFEIVDEEKDGDENILNVNMVTTVSTGETGQPLNLSTKRIESLIANFKLHPSPPILKVHPQVQDPLISTPDSIRLIEQTKKAVRTIKVTKPIEKPTLTYTMCEINSDVTKVAPAISGCITSGQSAVPVTYVLHGVILPLLSDQNEAETLSETSLITSQQDSETFGTSSQQTSSVLMTQCRLPPIPSLTLINESALTDSNDNAPNTTMCNTLPEKAVPAEKNEIHQAIDFSPKRKIAVTPDFDVIITSSNIDCKKRRVQAVTKDVGEPPNKTVCQRNSDKLSKDVKKLNSDGPLSLIMLKNNEEKCETDKTVVSNYSSAVSEKEQKEYEHHVQQLKKLSELIAKKEREYKEIWKLRQQKLEELIEIEHKKCDQYHTATGMTATTINMKTCTTTTPLDLETATTVTPLDMKTGTTASPVDMKTETTVTPLDLKTYTTTSPLDLETETTASPLDLETGTTASPLDLETCTTASPLDLETCTTASPLDLETETTASPLDLETGTTASPLDLETCTTASPLDMETETTVTPLDLETGTTASHVDLKTGTTASPLDMKTGTTASPVDMQTETTVTPLDLETGRTASPLDLKTGTTASPLDMTTNRIAAPLDMKTGTTVTCIDMKTGTTATDIFMNNGMIVDKNTGMIATPLDRNTSTTTSRQIDTDYHCSENRKVEKKSVVSNVINLSCQSETQCLNSIKRDCMPVSNEQKYFKNNVPQSIPALQNDVPRTIPALQNNIPQTLPALQNNVPQTIPALQNNVPQIIPALQNNVPQIIPAFQNNVPQIIPALQNNVPRTIPALQNNVPQTILALQNNVPQIIPTLQNNDPQTILALQNNVPQTIPALQNNVPQIIPALQNNVPQTIPALQKSEKEKITNDPSLNNDLKMEIYMSSKVTESINKLGPAHENKGMVNVFNNSYFQKNGSKVLHKEPIFESPLFLSRQKKKIQIEQAHCQPPFETADSLTVPLSSHSNQQPKPLDKAVHRHACILTTPIYANTGMVFRPVQKKTFEKQQNSSVEEERLLSSRDKIVPTHVMIRSRSYGDSLKCNMPAGVIDLSKGSDDDIKQTIQKELHAALANQCRTDIDEPSKGEKRYLISHQDMQHKESQQFSGTVQRINIKGGRKSSTLSHSGITTKTQLEQQKMTGKCRDIVLQPHNVPPSNVSTSHVIEEHSTIKNALLKNNSQFVRNLQQKGMRPRSILTEYTMNKQQSPRMRMIGKSPCPVFQKVEFAPGQQTVTRSQHGLRQRMPAPLLNAQGRMMQNLVPQHQFQQQVQIQQFQQIDKQQQQQQLQKQQQQQLQKQHQQQLQKQQQQQSQQPQNGQQQQLQLNHGQQQQFKHQQQQINQQQFQQHQHQQGLLLRAQPIHQNITVTLPSSVSFNSAIESPQGTQTVQLIGASTISSHALQSVGHMLSPVSTSTSQKSNIGEGPLQATALSSDIMTPPADDMTYIKHPLIHDQTAAVKSQVPSDTLNYPGSLAPSFPPDSQRKGTQRFRHPHRMPHTPVNRSQPGYPWKSCKQLVKPDLATEMPTSGKLTFIAPEGRHKLQPVLPRLVMSPPLPENVRMVLIQTSNGRSPKNVPQSGKTLVQNMPVPQSGKTFVQNITVPQSGKTLVQNITVPQSGSTLLQNMPIPQSGSILVQSMPVPQSGSTLLQNMPIPQSGSILVQNMPVSQSGNTVVQSMSVPQSCSTLVQNMPIPQSGSTVVQSMSIPQSCSTLVQNMPVPQSGNTVVQSMSIPQSCSTLVQNMPIPQSGNTVVQSMSIPQSCSTLVQNMPVPQSGNTVVQSMSIPQSCSTLVQNMPVPQSGNTVVQNITVPQSGKTLVQNMPVPESGGTLVQNILAQVPGSLLLPERHSQSHMKPEQSGIGWRHFSDVSPGGQQQIMVVPPGGTVPIENMSMAVQQSQHMIMAQDYSIESIQLKNWVSHSQQCQPRLAE